MAVIEFINGKNNSLSALKRVLEYIANPSKTEVHLKGGHNCNAYKPYNEMHQAKNKLGKMKGRQYVHFTQSFAPYDKVTPELVKEIADELVKHPSFNGYQVSYAVHTDRDHLHTHFVVNTVHTETGKKWRQSKEELQAFKDYSDNLCRKHGLIITNGKKGNHVNRGEY
jgi:alpha-N-acetylglucosamine transferase